MPKRPNEEKIKLQKAMASVIKAAGYDAISKDVRKGKNVEGSVKYFLNMYKRTNYGKFYKIKDDGSIDRAGKIDPERRAH